MTEYRLISSDSHVTMPDDAWQEYLDPEFRDRAPRIERTDDGDFRVEERHYMRENKSVFMNRKSLVLQERLFFRNIPLSNWVEHEMVVEEGSDVKNLAKQCSIFSTRSLSGDERPPNSRLLKAQEARTA